MTKGYSPKGNGSYSASKSYGSKGQSYSAKASYGSKGNGSYSNIKPGDYAKIDFDRSDFSFQGQGRLEDYFLKQQRNERESGFAICDHCGKMTSTKRTYRTLPNHSKAA